MPEVFTYSAGTTPLLISVPHDGREIPDDIATRMSPAGLDIPDTDWHVAKLYRFAAAIGASILVANYSRFVVDLNRPDSDETLYAGQVATGLCPSQTFAGENIYLDGSVVGETEKSRRISAYWRPYHDQLARTLVALRQQHGYALLWDAHSIPGVVPRLFDGKLPDLNIGTSANRSCDAAIAEDVFRVATASPFSAVLNGRFRGGHITRHYGDPAGAVQAVQLEIAQHSYMNETTREFDETRANTLRATILEMLEIFMRAAKRQR